MKLRDVCLAVALVCFVVISAHADGIPSDGRIMSGMDRIPVVLIVVNLTSKYI